MQNAIESGQHEGWAEQLINLLRLLRAGSLRLVSILLRHRKQALTIKKEQRA